MRWRTAAATRAHPARGPVTRRPSTSPMCATRTATSSPASSIATSRA